MDHDRSRGNATHQFPTTNSSGVTSATFGVEKQGVHRFEVSYAGDLATTGGSREATTIVYQKVRVQLLEPSQSPTAGVDTTVSARLLTEPLGEPVKNQELHFSLPGGTPDQLVATTDEQGVASATVNYADAGSHTVTAEFFNPSDFFVDRDGALLPEVDSKQFEVLPDSVNDAPVLDASSSPSPAPVAEDSGVPSGVVGTPVSALVDFASPSGQLDNVSDPDSGALLGIAVVGVDAANVSCFYSLDNGSSWTALGAVSQSSARLLAADADNRLYCRAKPDFHGTVSAALTFRAWDRIAGADGDLADTSTNGGETAFSAATDTAAPTVTPVNDAPTVTVAGGGSCGANDRSGTINLTVLDVDNAAGTLTISAQSSNPALVLNANANLVFGGAGEARTLTATAVSGSTGTAVLTITVSDGQNTGTVPVTVKAAGNANNTQTGSAGADMLFAQGGNDTVAGLGGNDLLCGGAGNDQLSGGEGDDTMTGGDGNDGIAGGAGNDAMAGGAGGDRFSGGPGTDTAADFNATQGDTQDGTIP